MLDFGVKVRLYHPKGAHAQPGPLGRYDEFDFIADLEAYKVPPQSVTFAVLWKEVTFDYLPPQLFASSKNNAHYPYTIYDGSLLTVTGSNYHEVIQRYLQICHMDMVAALNRSDSNTPNVLPPGGNVLPFRTTGGAAYGGQVPNPRPATDDRQPPDPDPHQPA